MNLKLESNNTEFNANKSTSSKRKLCDISDDENVINLPAPVPVMIRNVLYMNVKIYRCTGYVDDPIVLIIIQNSGGWESIISGHHDEHLIPTAEVLSGRAHWYELIMRNYGAYEDLCKKAIITNYPQTFVPVVSGLEGFHPHNIPKGTLHAFGFATYPPTYESTQKLEDLMEYLRTQVDGKSDNLCYGGPNLKVIKINYKKYNLSEEELPYINIWINRHDYE